MLSTAFVIENRKSLCHSLGRPSRSDFVQFQIVDENHIHLYEQTEMAAAISKEAILGGLELRTIESHHIDLEDYYMILIGGATHA